MQRPSSCTPMRSTAQSDVDESEYPQSSVRKRMLCRALNRRSIFQSMDSTQSIEPSSVERSRFDEIRVDLESAFDDLGQPVPEPVTPVYQPKACDECQCRADELSELQEKYDKLEAKYQALKAKSKKKLNESSSTIDFLSQELDVAKSLGLNAELNRPLKKSDENAPTNGIVNSANKSKQNLPTVDAKQRANHAYDQFILNEIKELKDRLGKAESDNQELKTKFSKHLKTRI